MTDDDVLAHVRTLEGVVVWTAGPGDGSPQIAWGDSFVYYSPDGSIPTSTQPFATVVTKDYPEDTGSRLERPGVFRVNIHVGRRAAAEALARQNTQHEAERTAQHAGDPADPTDPAAADVLRPHPVYASAGWLAVVNPGRRTGAITRALLSAAHEDARARYERHHPDRIQAR